MAATIEITGAWNGTACLSCSEAAGRHAASVMFAMQDDEVSDEEISDAIGELINVVGGNIKSLLPGPTEMSLPAVHRNGHLEVTGHLELAHEVKFSWTEEPVTVTVWTSQS
jgi:chemotaxis protein CheX